MIEWIHNEIATRNKRQIETRGKQAISHIKNINDCKATNNTKRKAEQIGIEKGKKVTVMT